jgi:glycerate dehydrogenase
MELAGKTMGVIGFGRIGRAVGQIAKAMGMRILATGSRSCPEGEAIAEYVDLDTLLRESDVVSLHCPLFPETEKLINRHTLAKMKDGAILLNNSRGGLVDEQALADALNSGHLRSAAVDVVSVEPILGTNPLLTAKNCIITPHMSWAATECRQRIVDITARNILAFLEGAPQNVVNP